MSARTSPNPISSEYVRFHCPKRVDTTSGRDARLNDEPNLTGDRISKYEFTISTRFSQSRTMMPRKHRVAGRPTNTISICSITLVVGDETGRRAPRARNGVRRRDGQISREICDRYTPVVAKRHPSGVGQKHVARRAPRIMVPAVVAIVYANRHRFLCCRTNDT